MKIEKMLLIVSLSVTLLASGSGATSASGSETGYPSSPAKQDRMPAVKVGNPAPGFTLEAVAAEEFKSISLSDYRGRWVVLFFYPLDFTLVCPTEIRGFNAALPRLRELNAEVLAISVDSKYSHLAWIKRGDLGKLEFPLLSDFNKAVARGYGILDEESGAAQRGLFIIDPEGNIQYLVVHNGDVGRSVEETLRILSALQTGELCPLGWKPGQKTLKK
jgi:alkyl hydroperoxide reductase subunit AhpC